MEAQNLLDYENWAVAGDVLNESKYAHRILNALRDAKFNVSGVNPSDKTGNAYTSLKLVPYKIDVLDLCINPVKGISVVKEAKKLNIDKILIQPGAESEEILDYCRENSIIAIEGCALVELSYYKRKK